MVIILILLAIDLEGDKQDELAKYINNRENSNKIG